MLAVCRWISGCRAVGIRFGRLDHVRNRGEDEAGRVLEGFCLQLPDPVHEDVGVHAGGPDQPAGAAIALHLDRLAHVADEDAVQPLLSLRKQALPRGLPEGRFEQVPVQPELIARVEDPAAQHGWRGGARPRRGPRA